MALSSVTLLLALSATSYGAVPTMNELRQALQPGNDIWITHRTFNRTTEGVQNVCIRVHIDSLTETECEFQQYYQAGQDKHQEIFYATLVESQGAGGEPGFQVSQVKGQSTGLPYTLMHWDGDNRCGVLQLELGGTKQYELHVLEGDADKENACLEKYNELTGGLQDFPVYSTACSIN